MKIKSAFILCSIFASSIGFCGADSSGGGGRLTDEQNPWFLGDLPIEYCINKDPAFPIERDQVAEEIKQAFHEWKQIFLRYRLYKKSLRGSFSDGIQRSLSVDAVEVQTCTDQKHQIEFKIGVVDATVKRYFEHFSKETIGFAYRNEYDHQTFRTGGFVWVSPNLWIKDSKLSFPIWQEKNRFKAIVMHEIGHVLGVPHFQGGVMDPNIFDLIQNNHNPGGADPLIDTVETNAVRLNPFFSPEPILLQTDIGTWIADKLGIRSPVTSTSLRLSSDNSNYHKITYIVSMQSGRKIEATANLSYTKNRTPSGDYSVWSFYSPQFRSLDPIGDSNTSTILDIGQAGKIFDAVITLENKHYACIVEFDDLLHFKILDDNGNWAYFSAGWGGYPGKSTIEN